MQIQAAIAKRPVADFEMEPLELSTPRDDEILVRIKAVGLRHTDLGLRDNPVGLTLAAVLGHEGAGHEFQGRAAGRRVKLCRRRRRPGISFDEMIPGEKPQGVMVPLIWSEGRRKDDASRYQRGFATTWDRGAQARQAAAPMLSYEKFTKKVGGVSNLLELAPVEDV